MNELALLYKCRLCGEVFESGAKTGDTDEIRTMLWINMEAKLQGKPAPIPMPGDTFASPFYQHKCTSSAGSHKDVGLADFAGVRRHLARDERKLKDIVGKHIPDPVHLCHGCGKLECSCLRRTGTPIIGPHMANECDWTEEALWRP